MKAIVADKVKKGAVSALVSLPFKFVKNIKTVTVAVSYTTRSEPDISKGKSFTFDVDKTKESIKSLFNKGESDMQAYQYEIIWVNEMGVEQRVYAETLQERDTKMQGLADDGYSPVWRDVIAN